MTWARFDDGYTHHPKVYRLSAMAELLDVRAIIHCARFNTDGLVRKGELPQFSHQISRLSQRLLELVEAGRWEVADGGWFIHDFLAFNPSKQEREEQKESNRDRQRQWRAKRNAVTNSLVTYGTDRESLKTQTQLAIDACVRCDKAGWYELSPGVVDRCDHEPPPTLRAVGGSAGA
jgi:hypothetical protein